MDRRLFLITSMTAVAAGSVAARSPDGFIHPLASTRPGASDDDLEFLRPLLRGKSVIGLGEATHGSHEIFEVKARLAAFLLRAGLIGTIAFELGFADGLALDRYVTHRSDASPETLLKDTKTFSISVAEIADLMRWLRDVNAKRPAASMARVLGYDIQTPGREAALLQSFLDRAGLHEKIPLGEHLAKLAAHKDTPIQAFNPSSAGGIKEDLAQLTAALAGSRAALEAALSPSEVEDMIQASTVIGRAFDLFAAPSLEAAYDQRDASGAANILAWKARDRRNIAVWAHNGHVNKGSFEFAGARLLGGRLAERLGDQYYAVATAFFEGEVRAMHAKEGVIVNHLPPARADSIDAFLKAASPAAFIVDLAAAQKDARWRSMIETKGVMRGVGAGYEPEVDVRTYRPTLLVQQFDAVVFIPKVTASAPL